ncbi:MAG: glycosyltransferase family 2 protein [Candidatus Methylacidiphilales bacterium]
MNYSVIIPFYNEEENAHAVLIEILSVLPDAEIIAVDDGSTDGTAAAITSVPSVRLISHPHNLGQSAALYHGLTAATGDICIMLDGDGQNDPHDIPHLLKSLDHADLVCGYRLQRRDTLSRRLASRTANHIRRLVLQDGVRDTGCSLKIMRREHVRYLIPFNGLHRFLPAFLKNAGLRIAEEPVNHRPRMAGQSKYTITGRALRGVRDLFGVAWLLRRQIFWPSDSSHPTPLTKP